MSLARMAAPPPPLPYERHRPEETLLYQLIETHYPAFRAQLEAQGQTLPAFVKQEFVDFLKCGRLDYGFLRVCCEDCKHERLVAFSCKRRGFCRGRRACQGGLMHRRPRSDRKNSATSGAEGIALLTTNQ